MEEHYDHRESLHAVKQSAENAGYDDVEVRDAWVILFGEYHFEYVQRIAIWALKKSDGRVLWMDKHGRHHQDSDIFESELIARNELEKKLFKRLVNLQKHRDAMTTLCVNCTGGT